VKGFAGWKPVPSDRSGAESLRPVEKRRPDRLFFFFLIPWPSPRIPWPAQLLNSRNHPPTGSMNSKLALTLPIIFIALRVGGSAARMPSSYVCCGEHKTSPGFGALKGVSQEQRQEEFPLSQHGGEWLAFYQGQSLCWITIGLWKSRMGGLSRSAGDEADTSVILQWAGCRKWTVGGTGVR